MRMLGKIFFLACCLIGGTWAAPRAEGGQVRATFAGAIGRAMPAVVNIFAEKKSMTRVASADPASTRMGQGALKQKVDKSLGSGVIVDRDGTIVTNLHVVQGATDVQVVLGTGEHVPVVFMGADEKLDLAVLRMKRSSNTKLSPAEFGNSDSLRVGDVVMALGNPYGLGQSASMGIVSAVDRTNAELSPYSQYIQTDATINPGNSGGALIDSTGQLVGVNTAIYTKNGASQGIGFAIPANLVKQVVADIVKTGRVSRPWFGATGQSLTPELAARVGLADGRGVYLADVEANSPAAKAGLRVGDVLRSLNGKPLADPAALGEQIVRLPAGGRGASLSYWRAGKLLDTTIILASEDDKPVSVPRAIGGHSPLSGLVLADGPQGKLLIAGLNGNVAQMFPQLALGDVLLAVNGVNVTTVDALEAQLEVTSRTWIVRILRGGRVMSFGG